MKRPRVLRLFFGLGLLVALFVAIAAFAVRSHPTKERTVTTVVVSPSGQTLATLFEGSLTDTKFSVKDIIAKGKALPRCGKKTEISLLQSTLTPSVVYAAPPPCPFCDCGGSGFQNFVDSCDTGLNCSGSYNNIQNNPSSDSGYFCPHSHCGSLPECGCVFLTC
jgi:hypothetical protein